jgi:hypothetical protein
MSKFIHISLDGSSSPFLLLFTTCAHSSVSLLSLSLPASDVSAYLTKRLSVFKLKLEIEVSYKRHFRVEKKVFIRARMAFPLSQLPVQIGDRGHENDERGQEGDWSRVTVACNSYRGT